MATAKSTHTKTPAKTAKAETSNKALEKQVQALVNEVAALKKEISELKNVSSPEGNFVTRDVLIQGLRMCGARDRHIRRLG